jgi:hypothetical protein
VSSEWLISNVVGLKHGDGVRLLIQFEIYNFKFQILKSKFVILARYA